MPADSGIVTVMRVSKSPAASAALPRREQPVTPTFLVSISGTWSVRPSRTRWKPQAQARRVPVLGRLVSVGVRCDWVGHKDLMLMCEGRQ